MATLRFGGADYDCRGSETVLEAMLRQDAVVPYSCRNGVCLTCMMRSRAGAVPACAQNGLKDTLRVEGISSPASARPKGTSTSSCRTTPNSSAGRRCARSSRLRRRSAGWFSSRRTPLYYHTGQFVNLRRGGGLARSYSLASVPRLDDGLELHVKHLPRGRMST